MTTAAIISAIAAIALEPQPADPGTIWDREELYRTPKSWRCQHPLNGDVTPVWIEGEPWHGKPTRCFAYYGVPEGADRNHRVPAIVLIHGGDGTAYPEWVRLWVRRGYAAISVDTCGSVPIYMPGDRAAGTWMRHPDGGPAGWGGFDQLKEDLRDQWVYHAVAAAVRSHSFLRSLEGVDTDHIGVTGISWGGFITCIAAALDHRFVYAVPVYGCGFCHMPYNLASKDVGGRGLTEAERRQWAGLWDPSRFLPFAECPFLWVDGTNDAAFPLEYVRRSADLLKAPCAFSTRPRMVHTHGPLGEAPAEILAFADHYSRGKADVARFKDISVSGSTVSATVTGDRAFLARASAALLYTTDGDERPPKDRYWRTLPIEPVDLLENPVLKTTLPPDTKAWFFSLTGYDGKMFACGVRW